MCIDNEMESDTESKNTYELIDGSIITVGGEWFRCSEMLCMTDPINGHAVQQQYTECDEKKLKSMAKGGQPILCQRIDRQYYYIGC